MDSFACEIDPGTMIHAIEKPPNEYHCPEMQGSWHSEVSIEEAGWLAARFRPGSLKLFRTGK